MQSSLPGGTTNQSAVNNATRSNVTSPWPTTGSAAPAAQATRSATGSPANGSGWSSIGTSIAAPPLIVPQSPMAAPNYTGAAPGVAAGTTAAGRSGPNLPAPPTNDQQSLHSVLTDPSGLAPPAAANNQDWTKSWNNNSSVPPATISRTSNQPPVGGVAQDSGLVPVQGSSAAQGDPRTMTTARPNDNGLDSWNNQSQAPAATNDSMVNRPSVNPNVAGPQLSNPQNGPITNAPNGQFANTAGAQSWNQPNGQFTGQPNGQAPNGQQIGNYNPASMNPSAGQMAQGQMNNGQPANNQFGTGTNGNSRTQAGVGNSEQPWVPMVLAVIGLAMSFAANLYLGASYLDARQKYQSLVRKTADTFRRVSAAAA
jgi:hypothetical protein